MGYSNVITVIVVLLLLLPTAASIAQYSATQPPAPSAPYKVPKSYTDYYTQHVQSFHRPPVNVRQYTVDKYFYHRPTISPYLNLARRTGPDVNKYYTYVLPEVQRRQQMQPAPNVPRMTPSTTAPIAYPVHTPLPVPKPSPYFNQFYGGKKSVP